MPAIREMLGSKTARILILVLLFCSILQILACHRETRGSHTVTLTWNESASAGKREADPVIGYNVYRGTKSQVYGPEPINALPIEGTKFVDTGVESGKTYYYVVKTVTSRKVESVLSNETVVIIPPN